MEHSGSFSRMNRTCSTVTLVYYMADTIIIRESEVLDASGSLSLLPACVWQPGARLLLVLDTPLLTLIELSRIYIIFGILSYISQFYIENENSDLGVVVIYLRLNHHHSSEWKHNHLLSEGLRSLIAFAPQHRISKGSWFRRRGEEDCFNNGSLLNGISKKPPDTSLVRGRRTKLKPTHNNIYGQFFI